MIVVARIDGIARQWQGDDLFSQLVDIAPEGRCGTAGHMFSLTLNVDDTRVRKILERLRRTGVEPWTDRTRLPNRQSEFTLEYQRVYDAADLDVCEYLEIVAPYVDGVWKRQADTALVLKEPTTEWDIVSVRRPNCYAAIGRAKQALEGTKLRNLSFRCARKQYESVDYDLYDEDDTWWEMRSDALLPPVAPSMTLVHKDRTPFKGECRSGCLRTEGFYTHPELHYRREDIASMKAFDLAHTYEMFGELPDVYDRPLVASKRFYEVCKEHGIRTGWVPVRIDE
jgi:hypothetical protein